MIVKITFTNAIVIIILDEPFGLIYIVTNTGDAYFKDTKKHNRKYENRNFWNTTT